MDDSPRSLPGQAELETVLLHAADAITVQAPDGSLVYANLAAARTLGFESPEALLATPIREVMSRFELLDEEGHPLPLDALPSRRALAGGTGPPSVVRFRDVASGDDHWSLVQAMPIMDDAGAVRLVINTFQDVTQLQAHRAPAAAARRRRLGHRSLGGLPGRTATAGRHAGRAASATGASSTSSSPISRPREWRSRMPIPRSASWRRRSSAATPPTRKSPGGVNDVIRTGVATVLTEVLRGSPPRGRPRRRALSPAAGRPRSAPSSSCRCAREARSSAH